MSHVYVHFQIYLQFTRQQDDKGQDDPALMVKQCTCGQKVTFDPIKESWPLTRCSSATFQNDGYATDGDVAHCRRQDAESSVNVEGRFTDVWKRIQNVVVAGPGAGYPDRSGQRENIYFAYPVVLDPDMDEDQGPIR